MFHYQKDVMEWIKAMATELTTVKKMGSRHKVLHIGGFAGKELDIYLTRHFCVHYCQTDPGLVLQIESRVADPVFINVPRKEVHVHQVAVGQEGIQDDSFHLSVPLWIFTARTAFDLLVIEEQGMTMNVLESGDPTAFRFIICEEQEAETEHIINFMKTAGFTKLDQIQDDSQNLHQLIFKNTHHD